MAGYTGGQRRDQTAVPVGGGGARAGHAAPQAPPRWRAPEGPQGTAAVLVGGGGSWPGFETTD